MGISMSLSDDDDDDTVLYYVVAKTDRKEDVITDFELRCDVYSEY